MSEIANDLLSLLGGDLSLRWIITLFHFLWQGTVVGLFAAVFGSMLRNASASMRYVLFLTALLSLPICVAVTFSFVNVPDELETATQSAPPLVSAEAISSVVVAGSRVLTVGKDFDLATGDVTKPSITRPVEKDANGSSLQPIYRRLSSDRAFVLEISHHVPGNTSEPPSFSFEMRVFRASNGKQVGRSITCKGNFSNTYGCAADVESRGNFVLLGNSVSVRVYWPHGNCRMMCLIVKSNRSQTPKFDLVMAFSGRCGATQTAGFPVRV